MTIQRTLSPASRSPTGSLKGLCKSVSIARAASSALAILTMALRDARSTCPYEKTNLVTTLYAGQRVRHCAKLAKLHRDSVTDTRLL